MIDILKDIVKHTHGLGFLDLVKITGDDKKLQSTPWPKTDL